MGGQETLSQVVTRLFFFWFHSWLLRDSLAVLASLGQREGCCLNSAVHLFKVWIKHSMWFISVVFRGFIFYPGLSLVCVCPFYKVALKLKAWLIASLWPLTWDLFCEPPFWKDIQDPLRHLSVCLDSCVNTLAFVCQWRRGSVLAMWWCQLVCCHTVYTAVSLPVMSLVVSGHRGRRCKWMRGIVSW